MSLVAAGLPLAFGELSAGVPVWSALCGLALALMLRWPSMALPLMIGVFIGGSSAHWAAGLPAWRAAGLALGPVLGAVVASQVMHWMRRDSARSQHPDVGPGLILGAAVAAGLSTTCTLAWQSIAAGQDPGALLQRWPAVFVADALGVLLIVPAIVAFERVTILGALQADRRMSVMLLVIALSLSTWAAATLSPSPLLLAQALLVPVIVVAWLALRHGTAPAAIVLVTWASAAALLIGSTVHPSMHSRWPQSGPLLAIELLALCLLVALARALTAELSETGKRWQLALEGSDLGVAEWNLSTGHGDTSLRWRQLLGEPEVRPSMRLEAFLARIHPDDRMGIDAMLLRSSRPQQAVPLRQEVRVLVHELWCWFDLNVLVCDRSANGTPLRLLATLMDIEAQRGAQERQHLSSNLFMHLHEGLLITDSEMRVLDANPTFSRITGIPRQDLLGTVPRLMSPGHDADATSQQQNSAMWAGLHSSGHWTGEVIDRRRNGDPCALHLTVSSVNGPDGELRYHVLVVSDVTEQRLQRERIERQAHFDELTRLPNRAHLSHLLLDAMRRAESDNHLLAVCYVDLDHFKEINERLGHAAGDRLLAELALRLRGALRSRGSTHADVAARLGGDEFALLLHAGSVEEARFAVERVLRLVSQPFTVGPGGEVAAVTASIGVTVYPLDGSDADTLLRHADNAMYGAKQSGRNGHVFFDSEHRRRTEERVLAIGRVQEALDENELTLYYQPKVDLQNGTVLGVEALLRWNHPDRGVVSPVHFLPLIEHTGLSARIGDHVLAQALEQSDAWQAEGLDLSVSVNITARHLQEPDFAQRLAELLARHRRPLGARLELEVLETAALADVDFTSAVLTRCAQLGVRWALDDFGTGYSTLTYLKRLPVQTLKIDRSFVHNMLDDPQDRAIVEGLVGLASSFDCVAVAEGVESAAQARMLLDMGCTIGQGEGIAPPMPASEVAAWVRGWRGLFALVPAQTGTPTGRAA